MIGDNLGFLVLPLIISITIIFITIFLILNLLKSSLDSNWKIIGYLVGSLITMLSLIPIGFFIASLIQNTDNKISYSQMLSIIINILAILGSTLIFLLIFLYERTKLIKDKLDDKVVPSFSKETIEIDGIRITVKHTNNYHKNYVSHKYNKKYVYSILGFLYLLSAIIACFIESNIFTSIIIFSLGFSSFIFAWYFSNNKLEIEKYQQLKEQLDSIESKLDNYNNNLE